MKTSVSLRLVLGLILIFVVACSKPQVEEERDLSTEIAPSPTSGQEATSTTSSTTPTNAPPPLPTAIPTTARSGWQTIGNSTSGLQFEVPGSWQNLTSQIDTAVATNPLGLIVLLAGDSSRTAESLLGGKPIENGAFAVGLISHLDLPPNTPQATLTRLTTQLNLPPADGDPVPVTAVTATGSQIPGAYIDIVGDPVGLAVNAAESLQTRLFLYTTTLGGAVSQSTQAIFLFTAPITFWDSFAPTFNEIAETAVIHNLNTNYTINDGKSNVIGSLGETDMVIGELQPGNKDIWTFTLDEPRYGIISIKPDNNALDLTFTLFGPNGQTIANIDNGYAGGTEVITDLLLTEPGLYVLEIGDFFNVGGRYTLSLILAKDPLYGGGGDITFGQIIEGTLPQNGKHGWTFNGNAGNQITLVLTPEDEFDAILELYAPDGTQLISLDEGYSGDAEVSTGIELPVTGLYTIAVHSFAGDGGRYALSLDEGSNSLANFYDAGDLVYGQTREESLQANEAHAWFFTGKGGDQVSVKTTPIDTNLNLDLWLLDGEVNRLAQVDNTAVSEAEMLTIELPSDGEFIILVRDVTGLPGRYNIQLTANPITPPNEAGVLRYGDSITSSLLPNQRVIWYFDAEEGEKVDITITPSEQQTDLLFYLYNPQMQHALDVDLQGNGQAEQLIGYLIPQNGRWGIVVQEFFNEGGSYTISLNQSGR